MNANPYAHFHNRERAAGFRPALPPSQSADGLSPSQGRVFALLREKGALTVEQMVDELTGFDGPQIRQCLFVLRNRDLIRVAGKFGPRLRSKIWEAVQ